MCLVLLCLVRLGLVDTNHCEACFLLKGNGGRVDLVDLGETECGSGAGVGEMDGGKTAVEMCCMIEE